MKAWGAKFLGRLGIKSDTYRGILIKNTWGTLTSYYPPQINLLAVYMNYVHLQVATSTADKIL